MVQLKQASKPRGGLKALPVRKKRALSKPAALAIRSSLDNESAGPAPHHSESFHETQDVPCDPAAVVCNSTAVSEPILGAAGSDAERWADPLNAQPPILTAQVQLPASETPAQAVHFQQQEAVMGFSNGCFAAPESAPQPLPLGGAGHKLAPMHQPASGQLQPPSRAEVNPMQSTAGSGQRVHTEVFGAFHACTG